MTGSYVDIHMAQKKMELKSCNACLSFISTLWKGEVIMCCFNNLNQEMADIFCLQPLKPEDVTQLEELIRDFINGG